MSADQGNGNGPGAGGMAGGALVVVEAGTDGAVRTASMEVVSAARALADAWGGMAVEAMALGEPGVAKAAAGLAEWGADRIVGVETEGFGSAGPGAHAAVVAGAARDGGHRVVLFSATPTGRDLAPRVAAKLACQLLTDVVALEADGGDLLATRPVYAGKALARVRCPGPRVTASLRPNALSPAACPREASVEARAPGPDAADAGYRTVRFEPSEGAALDVSEASIVVSGGRGMKGPERWGILEDLRAALGETAGLGASRAVVDAGWRPHAEQVGQTGKTVTPDLYFAVGISGAVQHLAGMRTAKLVVAVNADPDAPIFGVADYGIVGDLFEVVPAITEAVRKLPRG